jgi:hypothetical protein
MFLTEAQAPKAYAKSSQPLCHREQITIYPNGSEAERRTQMGVSPTCLRLISSKHVYHLDRRFILVVGGSLRPHGPSEEERVV